VVSKYEWDTKEGTGKSMKTQWYGKRHLSGRQARMHAHRHGRQAHMHACMHARMQVGSQEGSQLVIENLVE